MVTASTWQTLGLGVATYYAFTGSVAYLAPSGAADRLFALGSSALAAEPDKFPNNAESREDRAVGVAGALVAARNLALSAAALALYRDGNYRAMGTVLLSASAFIGVLDGVEIYKRRGPVLAGGAAALFSVWSYVGYALQEGFNS
ncbi:hypothetical protein Q8F55_006651 [Vanrija albida]|uniref:Uncharacterized protein n=1 Tax=Vanrija albida TaxID=181172 RepID=A0ABR3PXQ6_9TREE